MNVGELLAALPEDDSSSSSATAWEQEKLQEIFADLANRPAPTGSLHRLWTISELSSEIALAYLNFWVRGWFSDAEASQRRLAETNLRVALKLFHRLGYLRGAMAKLGQTLGNLPGIVPNDVSDTLDRLHFDAPPMHFPLVREVVRNEFGKGVEELFREFDTVPFAAASLGQVHRARLKSGERVAVKIQYPGIARTINADFRNLAALLFPMRLGKNWDYTKAQFEEIRRMLNQEVDYEQEAESTRAARKLFRPEDGIVVPEVYAEYSGKRVLTTEFLEGVHLDGYLATNPVQSSRNDFGTRLYTACNRMVYAFMPYVDPHPGNYLFLSDGRLGLLDFGCVQHYGAEEREIMLLADRLAFDDPSLIPVVVQKVCGVSPGDSEFPAYVQMMTESREWAAAPFYSRGPFDFGDERYFRAGVENVVGMMRKRMTGAHPMYVYWNRGFYGVLSMLLRLRAQVNAHEIIRRERAAAGLG